MRMTKEQQTVAQQFMPLAHKIANKYSAGCPAYSDEIVMAAYEGLCMAALKYNTKHQTKFYTLAKHYIEGYVKNYIIRGLNLISLPRSDSRFNKYDALVFLSPTTSNTVNDVDFTDDEFFSQFKFNCDKELFDSIERLHKQIKPNNFDWYVIGFDYMSSHYDTTELSEKYGKSISHIGNCVRRYIKELKAVNKC